MNHFILMTFFGIIAISMNARPTSAAEATMRLRGSDLTFTGTVISFDGKIYSLETTVFGKVKLDIRRFECISGACSATITNSAAAAGPDFGIYGAKSAGTKLMPDLIGAYAKSINSHSNLKVSNDAEEAKFELTDAQGVKLASIDLKTHGSATAFTGLTKKRAAIGVSSRPINDEEANLLPSVRQHVLADDALLVVVSPQNPLSSISMKQLASVFSGAITDWSQLGQAPGKIKLYARNKGSGALKSLIPYLIKAGGGQIAPNTKRFGSDGELSDAISLDPFGIGVTSFGSKREAKALTISTSCGITYTPSIFDIKTKEYPFARHLFLYTTTKSSTSHAAGLVKYSLSEQAQKIISAAGFIDRSLVYLPFKNQGDRIVRTLDMSSENFNLNLMRKLIKDIGMLSRLSVTFHFRTASFTLDPLSRSKIQQLVTALSSTQMRDKEILLLGFSDAVGPFENNRELSVIRARQVKQEIIRISGGRIDKARLKEKGYGELLPVGCDNDPLGRARNRRVEVWFKAPASAPPAQRIVSTGPPLAIKQISSVSDKSQNKRLFKEFDKWRQEKQLTKEFIKWRKARQN